MGLSQSNHRTKSKQVTYVNSVCENVGRTNIPNSVHENAGHTNIPNSVHGNARHTDILNYFIKVRLYI